MKIVANSLPKSGTHLLTKLLELIGFERGLPLMGSLVRVDSTRNPIKKLQILHRKAADGVSVDLDDLSLKASRAAVVKMVQQAKDGQYFPAHIPYSLEMDSLLIEQNVRNICIIRDPRDVAVSYANYMLNEQKQYLHSVFKDTPDINHRLRLVVEGCSIGEYALAPLQVRIDRIIGWASSKNICIVKFENLIGASGGGSKAIQLAEIQKILDYLGLSYPDRDVDKFSDAIFDRRSRTFHSGQIHRGKAIESNELKELFKERCGNQLISLGYENSHNW